MRKKMIVTVTGAAGQIAYNLLFRIASGELFPFEHSVELRLLEIPEALNALEGVKMELIDSASPYLAKIVTTDKPEKAFKDAHLALLIGAKPRGPGMERGDLLKENAKHFKTHGRILDEVASSDLKALVVGNPCNTNCLVLIHQLKRLNPMNFHAMMRLDYNRAKAQIAMKAKVDLYDIENLAIWGNHSATQVVDIVNTTVKKQPLQKVIDVDWLENTLVPTVQKRGKAVIDARGKSSAGSATQAIIDTCKSFYRDGVVSSAMLAKGNPYGIDEDLVFSFPALKIGRNIGIDTTYTIDEYLQGKIDASHDELKKERDAVRDLL